MVNWEFFDNQTPESAKLLVDDLRAGREAVPTRGARLCSFKDSARILAGFPDERPGAVDESGAGGAPSLAGLRLARGEALPGTGGTRVVSPATKAHATKAPATRSRAARAGPSRAGPPRAPARKGPKRDDLRRAGREAAHPRAVGVLGRQPPLDARHLPSPRRLRGTQGRPRDAPGRRDRPGQGLRSARPRRRGLPHRPEVAVHPAERRQAALPGGQRGRVRAGHLQGHPAAVRQPALADRGHDHRVLRDPLRPRLHLPARRGRAGAAQAPGRRRRGLRGRSARPEHPRLRTRPGHHGPRRCRRLHLRRGDGAAGLAGGTPGPAQAAPAVPGHRRPLRLPDRGEQRRVDRLGAADPGPRQGVVQGTGHREVPRLHALLALRPRHQPRPVRGPARHHPAPTARHQRRHPDRPPAQVLDPGRLLHPDVHRRAP